MCETQELALEHSTAWPLILELHSKTELLVLKGKLNAGEALDTLSGRWLAARARFYS